MVGDDREVMTCSRPQSAVPGVKAPASQFRINIAMGSREYPLADAADPSRSR